MGNPFHSGERQRSEAAEQIIASRTEDAFQVNSREGDFLKNIRKRKGAVVFVMRGFIQNQRTKSQKTLSLSRIHFLRLKLMIIFRRWMWIKMASFRWKIF